MEKTKKQTDKKIDLKYIGKILALIAWVGVVCISSQFIVGYPMIWILGKETLSTPVWTTIYSAINYVVAGLLIIVVPYCINKKWKSDREEMGLIELPTFTDIGIGFIGFIATIFVANIIVSIFANFSWFDADQAQNVGYNVLNGNIDRITAFFALAIVAPIAEEIIFRGWLYGKLRKNTKNIALSIIAVSALFGFLHGQWNVGITVGVMSAIMCLEREMTGTIYAGILTHMIKNGIAFWMIFILHIT